jgi:hypothetical protein
MSQGDHIVLKKKLKKTHSSSSQPSSNRPRGPTGSQRVAALAGDGAGSLSVEGAKASGAGEGERRGEGEAEGGLAPPSSEPGEAAESAAVLLLFSSSWALAAANSF